MLLRRVTEHVLTQNWTAVCLDFLIVVAGVFIGIQVANWNDMRQDRALERVYLERLHDEALVGLDGFLATTDIAYTRRKEAMHSAYRAIFDDDQERNALDLGECNAIANTHSIIAFPHQFPSLEELNSSGRFSIIQDQDLRDHLTEYTLMQENSQSLVDYFMAEPLVIPLLFPEYFQVRLRNVEGAWAGNQSVTCRLDLMRADQQFKNTLTEAVSRFNGYYSVVLRPEIDRVKTIRSILASRLQNEHGHHPQEG